MTHDAEKSVRALRALGISDTAFARIRANLCAYAELHAIPDGAASVARRSLFIRIIESRQAAYAFGLLVLVSVSGGSVSFAAERAVPGDALYPVKVSVNEKVTATLAQNGEERALHNAKLAERRADEALALADSGRLDAETATYLSEKFALHVSDAGQEADALEAEGDISASLHARSVLASSIARKADAFEAAILATIETGAESDVVVAADSGIATAAFVDTLNEQADSTALASLHAEVAVLPGIAAVETINLSNVRENAQSSSVMLIASSSEPIENGSVNVRAINTAGGTQRIDVNVQNSDSSWTQTRESSGAPIFLKVGF